MVCLLAGTLRPAALACAARSPRWLAADYVAIARPASRRLNDEVASYLTYAHRNLRAAEARPRPQAVAGRWSGRRLLRNPFPARIDATAHALAAVNRLRIALTQRQARATSMARQIARAGQREAADAEVEVHVRMIRPELGLPPSSSS